MPLSATSVREALLPFNVPVDDRLASQISRYVDLLLFWNQKVNLTSVTSPAEILTRHFGESMFAADLIEPRDGLLVDVGSGAGFPGLPLKLACPGLRIRLVEPVMKKAVFLSEVVRGLDLSGVDVVRSRIEELPTAEVDMITSRALGGTPELLDWAKRSLTPSGRILLWLGSGDAASTIRTPGWEWWDAVPIPLSSKRVIQPGSPLY